jgi:hypothetical protein
LDNTIKNIGLSKQIENVCDGIIVHTNGVKDFHLFSTVKEMHQDLDRVMNDVHKLKRLLIKLEAGRGTNEKDQNREGVLQD